MTPDEARDRANALHGAAVASNGEMHPVAAARQLRAALRLLDRHVPAAVGDVEDDRLRGRILVTLALAESEQGSTDEGLRLLTEAEDLIEPGERGPLHGQRAILLRRTGHEDLALDSYAAALAVLDPDREPVHLASVHLNRAVLHLLAVHLPAARIDLVTSRDLAEGRDPVLTAKATHNLGYLDYLRGDLPAALRAYDLLSSVYDELAPGMLPVLDLDRGRALLAAGLVREADAALARAVDGLARQRSGQDLGEALVARAETALLGGRAGAARRHARRARGVFERRGNQSWAARANLLELRAELRAGPRAAQLDVLGERLEQSGRELSRLGLAEDARTAALLRARVLLRAGAVDAAEGALSRAAPRRYDRIETRMLWRRTRAELALARGSASGAQRHLVAGLATLERQRDRQGSADLQAGAAAHGRALATRGLDLAVASGRPSAILAWSERSRGQALLARRVRPPDDPSVAAWVAELRGLQAALAATAPGPRAAALLRRRDVLQDRLRQRAWATAGPADRGGRSRRAAHPPTLVETRRSLGGAALVVQLIRGRRLGALVLAGSTARLVDLGPVAPVREAVHRLRADLDAAAGRTLSARLSATLARATAADAARASDLLLGPLDSLVGDRPLVVVPAADLVATPWSALDPTRTRAVTVALSVASWLEERPRTAPLSAESHVLVVGGPRLDHAGREVGALERLTDHVHTLLGPDATTAAVLEALPRVDLAHVAAHGRHVAENPFFSGVDLVDGTLTGYDLQQLPRLPGLVALSSCEVGLHDVRAGDEHVGMVSAMLGSGCGTVIASVCRVDDATAATLMTAFYDGLRAGQSPSAALAAAAADGSAFVCFGAG